MKCLRCDECLKVYKDPVISMVSKTGNNFDFCSYKCAAETIKRFAGKEETDFLAEKMTQDDLK